ncbi:MAG: hypothetical protein KDA31_09105 [Phycisphaerales bacterium]|nr:hypothetical protein [Phycisphaerales bacterium]
MHTARRFVLAALLAPAFALSALAQDHSEHHASDAKAHEPTPLEESPIARMVGHWKGTGVFQIGPGQSEEVVVTETAQWRLSNNAILVNGLGTATDADGSERTVHDAIGVIRYDEEGKLVIHAFKADASPIVSEIKILDDGRLEWGFEPGPGQAVRFRVTFLEGGNAWRETGEFSPDGGKTWYPFFEMNLKRVEEG